MEYNTKDNKIKGWMNDVDLMWLFNTAKKMDTIVEIGAWKGRSTHALLSGCKGTVYAVDHFLGSQAEPGHHAEGRTGDVYGQFMDNVGHFKNLKVLKMDSAEAVKQFKNKSIDLVFIDGGHTRQEVIDDINRWLPKAKKVLCGHDYPMGSVKRAIAQTIKEVEVNNSNGGTIWVKEYDIDKIIDPETNIPLEILNADNVIDKPTLKLNINGFKMMVRRRYRDKSILRDELVRDVYRIPENPKVVIDVGAHVGGTTVRVAKMGATVYAFEPELGNYKLLDYNVRRNRLDHKVVRYNLGVGKPGRKKLYIHLQNAGAASCGFDESDGFDKDRYQIAIIISLKEVFENNNIEFCDLLKMDCEGCEREIIDQIDDELASKIGQISFEVHSLGIHFQEMSDKLSKYYDVSRLQRHEWIAIKKK